MKTVALILNMMILLSVVSGVFAEEVVPRGGTEPAVKMKFSAVGADSENKPITGAEVIALLSPKSADDPNAVYLPKAHFGNR